ncbi:MAG TPA: hypothetical protein VIR45_11255 [Kiloniellaceae bacterium]
MTAESAAKSTQTATPKPRWRDLLSVPLVLRFYSYLTGARHGSRV